MAVPFRVLGARSTAIDTVEVRFNHDVNPSISGDNFAIAQAYGLGPLPITSVSVKYNEASVVVIKTYTQIPFMFYKITMSGVRSLHTNELVDTNYSNNVTMFDGYSERNTILDNMIDSLSPIIANRTKVQSNAVEVETNVSKFFRGVADEVRRLYKEVGNTAMDNYLSLVVENEEVIRGKGNYDRFSQYGAFEITRVSKEPTSRAVKYTENAKIYFDGDVQLITQETIGSLVDDPVLLDEYGNPTTSCATRLDRFQDDNILVSTITLPYDAPELVNAGRFLRSGTDDKCITVIEAESASITSTPYRLRLSKGPVLKILFAFNATTGYAYPLTSYALKDNFYDANNAFMDTRLTSNEFRLNPAVGGFAPPSSGDKILVIYTYNNSTRRIIPDSVSVSSKASVPVSRQPGDTIPEEYYDGVNILTEDIADEQNEPAYGPSYLELARLQGLHYRLVNVNILDALAEKPAGAGSTSLAIFISENWFDNYGALKGVTMKRVDGRVQLWTDPTIDPDNLYNINPFVTEIPWTPSLSGRLKWGTFMVNYGSAESLVPETQIEYGVPTIDDFAVPAWLARKRILSVPSAIYASYIYLAQYENDVDYSLILDTTNIYTINPLLIGAITPINSTSSRLSSGQVVDVQYQYENVFVQGKDYQLFANVEECYEYVENRVSVNADGNVSINTLHYPLEEVNSVFSEGTGVQYPVTRMHDNYVEIEGNVEIKDAYERVEFKTVQETVDILTSGDVITLSNAMVLNESRSELGGDILVDVPYEDNITTIYGDGIAAYATTQLDHYLSVGQIITISGSIEFDGQHEIIDIVDTKHFVIASDRIATVTSGTVTYSINDFKVDKLGVRTAYLAGTDTAMQEFVANMYAAGEESTRLAGLATDVIYHPFEISPATIGDAYYRTHHPELIALFDVVNCENAVTSNPDAFNISQLQGCFKGRVNSSVTFEPTICVYDGGGYCMLTRGTRINADNSTRPSIDSPTAYSSQIDDEHLSAISIEEDGEGLFTLSGKTSPNYYDTPELCPSDNSNTDPNLYNLHAPCKSFSCCGYTSIFSKEVPFIDGTIEFYRRKLDLANRPILDATGAPVLIRREPYGVYSIDYVSGVVHTSLDPASVAANTQKQVTVEYATAAVDTKNPYITKVDGIDRQKTTKVLGGNAQVEVVEKMRVDRFDIGTIYFSDVCRFDGSVITTPSGQINSITVLDGGEGYSTAPRVLISGGGGEGGLAHSIISGGKVVKIIVDSPGQGYTSKPQVTVLPPNNSLGRQAKAIPNVALLGLNAARCTNYPYALPNPSDQFQGQYTPTGCIYDQSTTGYSVCAKMDGQIVAEGNSPEEADPDYIYRLSSTSKIHGICMETSCRFYTASGKQKDFAGYSGRGLYYPNCRNAMCPNYQPVYLGQDDALLSQYSYVADSLVIDYVYGDNGIDWSLNLNALQPSGTRYIGVEDDGEPYYVSYKIGAREPALYNNFAYALGTPLLDASSRRWAKEMYRKAIIGVISAYLAGPTFFGVDSLVEIFTETPPEILEGNTFGWILGENYIYTKPESLVGEAFYTRATATSSAVDPFNLGLWMRGNNVLTYDGQDNFKIASGSLDMFIAPEWQLKKEKVIVDLYQNSSQALRGIDLVTDPGIYSGLIYDQNSGSALVSDVGIIDYVIDAGDVVSWKSLEIDTRILPSFVDEMDKITITAQVRAWNDVGDDVYTDQQGKCGIYGFAYTDEYAPAYNEESSITFETITGTHGYTCPHQNIPACAIPCSGDECLELQCDCLSNCHETLFVDLDTNIAENVNQHVGKYLTFITGDYAGHSFIISDTTTQYVPQTSVKSMNTLYPHTNPQVGDAYVVPPTVPQFTEDGFANGWYGHENNIAVWNGLSWVFSVPVEGKLIWVEEVSYQFKWAGTYWTAATLTDTDRPNEQSFFERIGFILQGYISNIRETGLAYRIHHSPHISFPLSMVPTSRYLRVSLTFELDKSACDPYSFGNNYGAYPPATLTQLSTITLPNHTYSTGQPLMYYNGSAVTGGSSIDNCNIDPGTFYGGGDVIGGLLNFQTYYVIVVDGNTISLASTSDNALAGTFIPFSSTGVPMHYLRTINSISLTYPNTHPWNTGDVVTYGIAAGSASIGGLVDGWDYYVIKINDYTIQLADSMENALSGTALTLAKQDSYSGSYTLSTISDSITFALSEVNGYRQFMPDDVNIIASSLVSLTCSTRLGIDNIEVFYTNPLCAFEAPVISTLFDIWGDKDGDMFSNRMSIFRDSDNLLHFRVYEAKETASRHLVNIEPLGKSSVWPPTGDCRSYYEVIVDLDKIYNDNPDEVVANAHPCGLSKDIADAGSAEWTTRRRHYFGFSWGLNDGSVSCAEKNSNLHVFVDGQEYPKVEDWQAGEYDPVGWVNHGILCPDGTLYESVVREPRNGFDHILQIDKFIKRQEFDSLTLCEKPKVDPRLIDIYLEGWVEDTTDQWDALGRTDDVPLPVNIDYSGNQMKLYSDDRSSWWPCAYRTDNDSVISGDVNEFRMPAGVYISDVYDSLVNAAGEVIDPVHWTSVELLVSSSNLQRKMFSRARQRCDGSVLDSCHFDDCLDANPDADFPVIDVGSDVESVRKAIKFFYRTSEYSSFVEGGEPVPWVMIDYEVGSADYGNSGNYTYGGDYGDVIRECTDKIMCRADIDAYGRHIQYRVELFSDGSFTPIIYSMDFTCDKVKINDFVFPILSGRDLYIKPISTIGITSDGYGGY